jgi:hypothetical protein
MWTALCVEERLAYQVYTTRKAELAVVSHKDLASRVAEIF